MAQAVSKIHHLVEDFEDRYEVDPARGVVRKRVSIVRGSDVHAISHDGKVYRRDRKDGSFTVPESVAQFYLARPGWHEGPGVPPLPTPEEIEAELATKQEIK